MKQFFCLAAFFLLTACTAPTTESASHMTQEIVQNDLVAESPASSSTTFLPQDPQSLELLYYLTKAEKDVVELDMDTLEADYRIGKLSQQDFNSQKDALTQQKQNLKAQEKQLEIEIASYTAPADLPTGTVEALRTQLRELEAQEDLLDDQKDRLESEYFSRSIDRESFVEKQADLIRQEDILDEQEDLLENALERLGWDD